MLNRKCSHFLTKLVYSPKFVIAYAMHNIHVTIVKPMNLRSCFTFRLTIFTSPIMECCLCYKSLMENCFYKTNKSHFLARIL